MIEMASVVVFTEHLPETIAFYRKLGVPLDDEDHGDGHLHAAGDVGGIHVAVFPGRTPGTAPGWRAQGSTFLGFWVPSLDGAMAALEPLGVEVLLEHEDTAWGCRFVVADPDGRAVEVNQRDHCPTPRHPALPSRPAPAGT